MPKAKLAFSYVSPNGVLASGFTATDQGALRDGEGTASDSGAES